MHSAASAACGLTKIACFTGHVLPRIERFRRDGDQGYGCCPWHDDTHASMSITPGNVVRFVWCCEAGCDPADVRLGLLRRSIPEGCLGTYGTSRRPSPRDAGEPDSKKLLAISDALSAPGTPAILRIRIRNIIDGRGDDLPRDRAEFLELAERAGVGKSQRYVAWEWFYVSNGLG
jgi:hypothetical protein